MLESLSLDNKSVVITGGGTGLGKEMTLSLARAGANILSQRDGSNLSQAPRHWLKN